MKAICALGISILVHAAAATARAAANDASQAQCAHGSPDDKLVGSWEDSEQSVEKEYRLSSTGKVLPKLSSADAVSCLEKHGGRIIFAGDSYMRNLYIAFLDVLEGNFSSQYLGHLKREIKYKPSDLNRFSSLPQIPQRLYTHTVGYRTEGLEIRTILPDGGSDGSFIRHLDEFLAPAVFESNIYVIGSLVHDIVRGAENGSRIEAYLSAVREFFKRIQNKELQKDETQPLIVWVNAPYFGQSPLESGANKTSEKVERVCPACDVATKLVMKEIEEVMGTRKNIRVLDWWSMTKACKPACLADGHHIQRVYKRVEAYALFNLLCC